MSRLVNTLKKAREPDTFESENQEIEHTEVDAHAYDGNAGLALDLDELELHVPDNHENGDESSDEDSGNEATSSEATFGQVSGDEPIVNEAYSESQDAEVDAELESVADEGIATDLYEEVLQGYINQALTEPSSDASNQVDEAVLSEAENRPDPVEQSQELSIADRFALQKTARIRRLHTRIGVGVVIGGALMAYVGWLFFTSSEQQSRQFADDALDPVEQMESPETVAVSPASTTKNSSGDRTAKQGGAVATNQSTAGQSRSTEEMPQGKSDDALPGSLTISVSKRNGRTAVSASLDTAFTLLQAGNVVAAEAEYQKVLQLDPENTAALEGLGKIAYDRGDIALAERHFHNAVNSDSSSAYAVAMLSELSRANGSNDGEGSVQDRNIISFNGQDHFAIGYAYAGNGEWRRAQEKFFEAWRLDEGNASYAYHLAIALDQIGKPDLAKKYYVIALENQNQQGSAIDVGAVTRRLQEIDGSGGK